MDREEIENRRIMSILEESDSEEDFLGDEEEGEESDHVSLHKNLLQKYPMFANGVKSVLPKKIDI